MRIGSSLSHQSGGNATRFSLVFEQMLFEVTRMVVVTIAHVASVHGGAGRRVVNERERLPDDATDG